MANVTTSAETNVITASQMTKARELDFVRRFDGSILKKLQEVLGVTRKIAVKAGEKLYVYETTGTLQDGSVAEGEIIPLSQYATTKTAIDDITIKKYRKAVTIEAIQKSGYDAAVNETDKAMLEDIQKTIRTDLFSCLTGFDGTIVGETAIQKVLAKNNANLQVLFENDSIETVHFIHPITLADYLGTATVSVQTAFGLKYIEDFLGLGTVIQSSLVPQGQVISTAKENIIMYYIPVNNDVGNAFNLTTDESGYIGLHIAQNDQRAQTENVAYTGVRFAAEKATGVVTGLVDASPTLSAVTVTSAAGSTSGTTKLTVSGYTLGEYSWKYKVGTEAESTKYGMKVASGWTAWDGSADITAATGKKLTLVAVDGNGRVHASGNCTVTAKA